MHTLDIIIFSVVLTSVSLAGAQLALLDLSNKADEVPWLNKIVGWLGIGSTGFAFFGSYAVMGDTESAILNLLVISVFFLSVIVRRFRKRAAPRPKKQPLPDTAISSLEPNPELAWCGHCQAHTLPGETTVRKRNEYGATYMTYQKQVCGHCRGHMLWNVPSHIRQTTNWTLGCSTVIGSVAVISFVAYGYYHVNSGTIGLLAVLLLLPVLAFLAWVLYLRMQWCRWRKRQSGTSSARRSGWR